MPKVVKFFPPNAEALRFIANHMREADKREVKAASGMKPLAAIQHGIQLSHDLWCLYDPKGWPSAVLGVVPLQRGALDVGAPWLLGTDSLILHKRWFHREAREVCDKLVLKWGVLTNLVDARNTAHINWLRHLGFRFGAPVISGVEQRPFLPFSKTIADV